MIPLSRPPIQREGSSLLGTPSHAEIKRLHKNQIEDYNLAHTDFGGLKSQMAQVALSLKGLIPDEHIDREVEWFYTKLDIDYSYFANDSVKNIRSYILSLWSAKLATNAKGSSASKQSNYLVFDRQYDDHAVFFDSSHPGRTELCDYEKIIDERYLSPSTASKAFRVESFRCVEQSPDYGTLRCYFVCKCKFAHNDVDANETNLEKIADINFLSRASAHTKSIYKELIKNAVNKTGPVTEIFEIEDSSEARLLVAYRQQSAPGFFKSLTDLYHYYNLASSRKYVDQFANGITIVCLYLKQAPVSNFSGFERKMPSFHQTVVQVHYETSLLYCLPQSAFERELEQGLMSIQEAVYAHCALVFVSQFVNRLGSEYERLAELLKDDSQYASLLLHLKKRLRSTSFTKEYIAELMRNQLDLMRDLYLHFAAHHYVPSNIEFRTSGKSGDSEAQSILGFFWSRDPNEIPSGDDLKSRISKLTAEDETIVLGSILTFNQHILKTNYFTPTKVALSFRLEPSFLPPTEYPDPLFGMFLVVGQEFIGFHLRFRDVARGGIRIVKSRNKEAHSINSRQVFDENYNLANTQQRKNKDIPEGGSKGVILLNADRQDSAQVSFQKYIDSIIDLLIPGSSPGIKEAITDYYGKEEILFMGPDENTAGLVDWATEHAKKRKAPWWKSFFTGKSPEIGGIPHDQYGMTSLSVREYVKGIYRKSGLEDKVVNKLQTGGPDGDLGSNEILLSTPNERYIAIVDGSGVLADPKGLDRGELRRLAKQRQMVSSFDKSKLSDEGYLVLIEDTNVKLPNGLEVENGVVFRNTYHLQCAKLHAIDVFVPCGGRPEAVNVSNAKELIDPNTGKTLIPYIVEGANLFLTQSAKLILEEAGAIIYKDASANKGGVTSSSLEVLASLAFDDKGFFANMCMNSDTKAVPEFYHTYVRETQKRIQENAMLEFEAIWKESESTGVSRSELSDDLSKAINVLSDELGASSLWNDAEFRNSVLKEALPVSLVRNIGLEAILERVPAAYLRAIFASYLAGRYIYAHGTRATQFAFYDFMTQQRKKIPAD